VQLQGTEERSVLV